MAYHIRPLSFSEILDRSMRVLVDNFWLFTGIPLIYLIPHNLLVAKLFPRGMRIVVPALSKIVGAIVDTVVVCAVAKRYLDRPATMLAALWETLSIISAVLSTYILTAVLLLVALLALVVPEIYLAGCWCFIIPVMVVERIFGRAALRRSRELVWGAWWRTAALTIFPGILVAALEGIAVNAMWGSLPLLGPVLRGGAEAVIGTYLETVLVVYYFDRRCRTEDFDLRLLAEQIRSEGNAVRAAGSGAASAA